MELPLSRPPSPIPPPPDLPSLADYLPFDRDPRLDDTTEFLDCCSLEYGHPGKVTVVASQPRRPRMSTFSPDDCELDASYSEIVEAPWTKGSRSDGGSCGHSCRSSVSEGSVQHEGIMVHEVGSETESVVVSAPLHGPATVRYVCVCKKRNCKFLEKPFDAESVRESPISRMSVGYRLVTWLSAMTPQRRRRSDSPLATDQIDVGVKVHPEKRSKIIQVLRCGQWRSSGGDSCHGNAMDHQCPGLECRKKLPLPAGLRRLRGCHLSVPRTLGVMLGVALVMLGVTYDHGVKHSVDDLLQDCWSWLRTSYMNFGDEFVSYNSIFFRMSNRDALYGEPYPNYINKTKKPGENATSFQDAISKVNPKFLYVLEGLKLSVQLHFFSIDERSDQIRDQVMVHDQGPLFFRISFRRTVGLQIDYVPSRSNMTLSTPFQIYDLMKMIIMSNGLPYFGMHMHDYLPTTPSALFSMIIDNLNKFKVDTTFLSSIQAQIQRRRRPRRQVDLKKGARKPSVNVPAAQTTSETTTSSTTTTPPPPTVTPPTTTTTTTANTQRRNYEVKATATERPSTVASEAPTTTRAAGMTTPYLTTIMSLWNQSNTVPFSSALDRTRRSTEGPTLRSAAWKSLADISRKIFLPLPLDTKKSVLVPVTFLQRNLTLKYRHSVNVLGLPGYQFVLGNDISRNASSWGNPHSDLYPSLSYSRVKDGERVEEDDSHIQRHRANEKRKHLHHRHSKHQNVIESDSYRKSFTEALGVVDLQPLIVNSIGKVLLLDRPLENYPFWLSPPHFLSLTDHMESGGRTRYTLSTNATGNKSKINTTASSKNLLIGVEGVQANESIHGSFIYYHPILGVPINASLAVQIGIRPPEGMLHAHKLVPIMWTRIQVEEVPRSLWYILWAACHLRETIMGCFICSGLLIITCSLTCRRKKKKKRKRKPEEPPADTA